MVLTCMHEQRAAQCKPDGAEAARHHQTDMSNPAREANAPGLTPIRVTLLLSRTVAASPTGNEIAPVQMDTGHMQSCCRQARLAVMTQAQLQTMPKDLCTEQAGACLHMPEGRARLPLQGPP